MPRVDIWSVEEAAKVELTCGFAQGLENNYDFGATLGQGGFGMVRIVKDKKTGHELACKSIQKKLDIPSISPDKQLQHLENIKREVAILRKLRGTLNVVHLEEVYEDGEHVHIVMEHCKGGELLHSLGKRHYSERTAASFMRAVLRTLAQCHHLKILHRDIKPGNFMLLSEEEDAPLKAIDFGLAVFYDPKQLPRGDLGLEGTPWYMAPEVLSSAVEPASDIWAAGVMAYQLLSGQFPFNDRKNTRNPALSLIWRSILTEEPSFSSDAWADISDEAKQFCEWLLIKDPKSRPTAKQALAHPWLQGTVQQRKEGRPLAATVVQRLQRFTMESAFKRTVLDMIATELLQRQMASKQQEMMIDQSVKGIKRMLDSNPNSNSNSNANLAASGSAGALAQAAEGAAGSGHGGSLVSSPFANAPSGSPHATVRRQVAAAHATRLRQQAALDLLLGPKVAAQLGAGAGAAGGAGAPRHYTVHSASDAYKILLAQQAAKEAAAQAQKAQAAAAEGQAQAQAGQQSLSPTGSGTLGGGGLYDAPPYKGPVKSRKDDSGHALQHYAFLLGVGERSFHGARERSLHGKGDKSGHSAASRDRSHHSPGGGSGHPPSAKPASDLPHLPAPALPAMPKAPRLVGGSLRGADEMAKLLDLVQRQRGEHRKMQRLMLDTSGRNQATFKEYLSRVMEDENDSRLSRSSMKRSIPEGEEGGPGGEGDAGEDASSLALSHPGTLEIREEGSRQGTPRHARGGKGHSVLSQVGHAIVNPIKNIFGKGKGKAAAGKEEGEGGSVEQLQPQAQGSALGASLSFTNKGPMDLSSLDSAAPMEVDGEEGGRRGEKKEALRAEEGGRGIGMYGALMRASIGPGAAASGPSTSAVSAATPTPAAATSTPAPAGGTGLRINTVKAHRLAEEDAPAEPEGESLSAQVQRALQAQEAAGALPTSPRPARAGDDTKHPKVPQAQVKAGLGLLMGSPAQMEEFQEVMRRLHYDQAQELTCEQISEGLQWLGYRLEASEVSALLQEVGMGSGDTLTQSQFVASQVDWREFQTNHREEWMSCLRKAFEELDVDKNGKLSAQELIALLQDKLPEDEVNLAVQETLMDAAVDTEGLDFDDFVKLVRANSFDSEAMSAQSFDLYDARLADPQELEHYQPGLATVVDEAEAA